MVFVLVPQTNIKIYCFCIRKHGMGCDELFNAFVDVVPERMAGHSLPVSYGELYNK